MKCFFRAVVLATVLAIIAGIGWDRVRDYHRKSQAQRVEAALARRISLHELAGYSRPLKDVLQELGKGCDIPLVYSPRQLAKDAIDLGRHVDVPDAELPLETALRVILRQRALAAVPYRGQILLTTFGDANSKRYPQIHPLPPSGPESRLDIDQQSWQRLMPRDMADLFEDISSIPLDDDESAMSTQVAFPPGGVVIAARRDRQRRASTILGKLEEASSPEGRQLAGTKFAGIPLGERQIFEALEKPVQVHFENVLLTDALAELSQKHQVPIFLHYQRLADTGIEGGWRTKFSADGLTLRSVLAEIVGEHDLGFFIQDGMIQVTSPSELNSHLRTAVYNVADLLSPASVSATELPEIISMHIGWIHRGYAGDGLGRVMVLSPGWLVTRQTEEDHRRIARLLAQIRLGLLPRSSPTMVVPPARPPGEEKLQRALAQEVTLVYRNQSLRDICADLSQRLGVRVVFEEGLLRGEDDRTPTLTCDLPPLPLRQALTLLRQEVKTGLGFTVRNETLFLREADSGEMREDPKEALVLDLRELVQGATPQERQRELTDIWTFLNRSEHLAANSASLFGHLLIVRDNPAGQRSVQFLNLYREAQLASRSSPHGVRADIQGVTFEANSVAALFSPPRKFVAQEVVSFLEEAAGIVSVQGPWRVDHQIAMLGETVVAQGDARCCDQVRSLMEFLLRRHATLIRAEDVYRRSDVKETERLLADFAAATDPAERAYLAFLLRFTAPPPRTTWSRLRGLQQECKLGSPLDEQLGLAMLSWALHPQTSLDDLCGEGKRDSSPALLLGILYRLRLEQVSRAAHREDNWVPREWSQDAKDFAQGFRYASDPELPPLVYDLVERPKVPSSAPQYPQLSFRLGPKLQPGDY